MSEIERLKRRANAAGMYLLDHQIGVELKDNLFSTVASFFWNTSNEGRKVFRKRAIYALVGAIIANYQNGWIPFPKGKP